MQVIREQFLIDLTFIYTGLSLRPDEHHDILSTTAKQQYKHPYNAENNIQNDTGQWLEQGKTMQETTNNSIMTMN